MRSKKQKKDVPDVPMEYVVYLRGQVKKIYNEILKKSKIKPTLEPKSFVRYFIDMMYEFTVDLKVYLYIKNNKKNVIN